MKVTYSMATTWGGKKLHAIILRPEMKGERYPSDARTLCGLEFWSNYDAMIQHPDMSWSVPEALTCKKCIAIHAGRTESEELPQEMIDRIIARAGETTQTPPPTAESIAKLEAEIINESDYNKVLDLEQKLFTERNTLRRLGA